MRDAREPVAGSGHRPRGDGPPERRSAHPFCGGQGNDRCPSERVVTRPR
jgi:hypothetical protein